MFENKLRIPILIKHAKKKLASLHHVLHNVISIVGANFIAFVGVIIYMNLQYFKSFTVVVQRTCWSNEHEAINLK